MTNLRHLLWLILLFLLALLALFPFLARRQSNNAAMAQNTSVPTNAGVSLRFIDPPTSDPATGEYKFEILNKSRSPAVFPDTWLLLFDDGSLTNLSLPQTGHIRVDPGQQGTIAIARPTKTNSWRLVGNYYLEDSLFRAKVAVDQSPLKTHLPDAASSVQGKNVVSDWVK